jgi:hypothetical protein
MFDKYVTPEPLYPVIWMVTNKKPQNYPKTQLNPIKAHKTQLKPIKPTVGWAF